MPTVSRPRRTPLTVRFTGSFDPTAAEARAQAFDLLADALADLVLKDAREAVAARLGVKAQSIDREAHVLDAGARSFLERAATRGAA